ncbi:MAG TPA: mycothiol system anti-sigma-R factor [Marmoricola sp.]|nr:mycothiol system anti-sigma-R factor [Marmoricola sp.]
MNDHAHLGDHLDCSEVVSRMYFFLDSELDDGDIGMIETHLVECGPCLEKYDVERKLKALIARTCVEPAPEGLRDRILLSLSQITLRVEEA